ncbi:type-F conjugative transfer system secretin TraK [Sphingobium sp. Sx8-8]|uniref:type-F conjugative transfer system secretin TraK n=1 Tax=Sphingobium sp. Sx8-8 TaxID=2933617 RepID=UPI001F5AB9DE|nr:type-F conjugative transfer system secretin TraK [Sphingobium sp. Sx8-8]
MMSAPVIVIVTVIGSAAFVSRALCMTSRLIGVGLFGIALLLLSAPAFADQTIMAADSAQVDCQASAKDLTRISLVEDEFASVSKIASGNPAEDFSVVNEPVRGDIYLSVPDGFAKPALSFFGTSKRGYVYKFVCRVGGDQAAQIFVSNPAIASEKAAEEGQRQRPSPQDAAVELMQAMAANGNVQGYEMRQRALRPVQVGDLKVQMIAEYRGSDLTGKVLRIENKGAKPVDLDETTVAPVNTLAASIAEPRLGPGQITTAYLISRNGRP